MKNKLTVLICLMCMLALVLAGCGGEQTSNPSNPDNPDDPTNQKEPTVISIGVPVKTQVLDYETNSFTLWLEETTGYDIKFVSYATNSADYQKQLATETSVNAKLPDILWRFTLTDDEINRYGEDGYFLDLTEYLEDREKSANYWHMVETYLPEADQEYVWKMIHSDNRDAETSADADGPIYGFPTVETTLIDTMDFMPLINSKWLDVVNKQVPTTLAELKDVLIAFRDTDCNGNGVPDEVPMLGAKTGLGCQMIAWLINFFIYCDDTYYFNLDNNGDLYLPYNQEAYRNALRFINELVEENLLHTNTLTYSYKNLRTALQSGDTIGVTVGHPSLVFTADSDAFLNWEPMNLYGNAYDNRNQFWRNVFITDSCEDPDAAWNVLMTLCTEEGAFRLRYGERGVHWDWADEGATSVMGIPALIKVHEDIWGGTNNYSWLQTGGGVYPYAENEANQATGNEPAFLKHKYAVYQELRANFDAAKAKVDQSQVCPYLRFNEEEDEIAKTRSDLKKLFTTWQAYFITGDKDIDSAADWQEYLNALDKAGFDEYLAAGKLCYERMYKSGT